MRTLRATEWAAIPAEKRDLIGEAVGKLAAPEFDKCIRMYIKKPATTAVLHGLRSDLIGRLNNIVMSTDLPWIGIGAIPPFFLAVDTADLLTNGRVQVIFDFPQFGHNCDDCEYLGKLRGLKDEDLYLCHTSRQFVITRYGEELGMCSSAPISSHYTYPFISEALMRMAMIGEQRQYS